MAGFIRRSERGFTYIGLLIAVALIGIALSATAELVSTVNQRAREQQLLFVGDQFAEAIASYRNHSPGVAQYPRRLQDLLSDNRFPNVRRHLRRIYIDPMSNSVDWGLVRGPEGGIVGVYSKSQRAPLKKKGFAKAYESFADAQHYSDWQFIGAVDGSVGGGTGPASPIGADAMPASSPAAQ